MFLWKVKIKHISKIFNVKIGLDIFDFSSETSEGNSTNLARKQDLNVLYQVSDLEPIEKSRWPSETFSTSPLNGL